MRERDQREIELAYALIGQAQGFLEAGGPADPIGGSGRHGRHDSVVCWAV